MFTTFNILGYPNSLHKHIPYCQFYKWFFQEKDDHETCLYFLEIASTFFQLPYEPVSIRSNLRIYPSANIQSNMEKNNNNEVHFL